VKWFLTGGSGLVGGRFIEARTARGDTLHALARSNGSAKKVRSLGVISVTGDLDSTRAWRK
jgi:uncharacterized protein YbjT (DUF2867 family)